MDSIPPLFWMFIITILSLGVAMILFYIAMAVRESIGMIRESTGVLREVKEVVSEAKVIVSDFQVIASSVKNGVVKISGIVDTVNRSVIKPITAIGEAFGFISAIVPSFVKKKNSDESED